MAIQFKERHKILKFLTELDFHSSKHNKMLSMLNNTDNRISVLID